MTGCGASSKTLWAEVAPVSVGSPEQGVRPAGLAHAARGRVWPSPSDPGRTLAPRAPAPARLLGRRVSQLAASSRSSGLCLPWWCHRCAGAGLAGSGVRGATGVPRCAGRVWILADRGAGNTLGAEPSTGGVRAGQPPGQDRSRAHVGQTGRQLADWGEAPLAIQSARGDSRFEARLRTSRCGTEVPGTAVQETAKGCGHWVVSWSRAGAAEDRSRVRPGQENPAPVLTWGRAFPKEAG